MIQAAVLSRNLTKAGINYPRFLNSLDELAQANTLANRASPNRLGALGEDLVSGLGIGGKERITINCRLRIPDGINSLALSEIENVKSLSFTRQLRDFEDIANSRNIAFDLFVCPSTQLSKPLL